MDLDPKTSGNRPDLELHTVEPKGHTQMIGFTKAVKKVFRENHLANVTYPRGRRYPSPLLAFQSSTWTKGNIR
jgi:hypothetical protein